MMVLRSEVPLSSRLRTSCMLRGESTLVRMVEPGRSTLSCVSSSGSRVGIWIALPAAMAARTFALPVPCRAPHAGPAAMAARPLTRRGPALYGRRQGPAARAPPAAPSGGGGRSRAAPGPAPAPAPDRPHRSRIGPAAPEALPPLLVPLPGSLGSDLLANSEPSRSPSVPPRPLGRRQVSGWHWQWVWAERSEECLGLRH